MRADLIAALILCLLVVLPRATRAHPGEAGDITVQVDPPSHAGAGPVPPWRALTVATRDATDILLAGKH